LKNQQQNYSSHPSLTLPSEGFVRKGSNIFLIKSILGGKNEMKLKVCTTLTTERKLEGNFFQQTCAA